MSASAETATAAPTRYSTPISTAPAAPAHMVEVEVKAALAPSSVVVATPGVVNLSPPPAVDGGRGKRGESPPADETHITDRPVI